MWCNHVPSSPAGKKQDCPQYLAVGAIHNLLPSLSWHHHQHLWYSIVPSVHSIIDFSYVIYAPPSSLWNLTLKLEKLFYIPMKCHQHKTKSMFDLWMVKMSSIFCFHFMLWVSAPFCLYIHVLNAYHPLPLVNSSHCPWSIWRASNSLWNAGSLSYSCIMISSVRKSLGLKLSCSAISV